MYVPSLTQIANEFGMTDNISILAGTCFWRSKKQNTYLLL